LFPHSRRIAARPASRPCPDRGPAKPRGSPAAPRFASPDSFASHPALLEGRLSADASGRKRGPTYELVLPGVPIGPGPVPRLFRCTSRIGQVRASRGAVASVPCVPRVGAHGAVDRFVPRRCRRRRSRVGSTASTASVGQQMPRGLAAGAPFCVSRFLAASHAALMRFRRRGRAAQMAPGAPVPPAAREPTAAFHRLCRCTSRSGPVLQAANHCHADCQPACGAAHKMTSISCSRRCRSGADRQSPPFRPRRATRRETCQQRFILRPHDFAPAIQQRL